MSFYQKLYYNICEARKQNKYLYKYKSGLHAHHILPKHMFGEDDEYNITYLTVREHIIAHFLLWKIYKNENDLRSMHMLGANLTPMQRKLVGDFCAKNKIGIHGYTIEQRSINGKKGGINSFKNKTGIHVVENRLGYAKKGGSASIISPNNPWSYWASEAGRKERASNGGKANKGKAVMYKPGDTSFIRVNIVDIEIYLNNGYIFGSPLTPNKGHTGYTINSTRKKVSDGITTYESVKDAAIANSITHGAIIHRCKSTSKKNSNWHYC